MGGKRTLIGLFALGGTCVLVGCGSLSTTDGSSASAFFSKDVGDFGVTDPLVVNDNGDTVSSATVTLPHDLLLDAPDRVALRLGGRGLQARCEDGESGDHHERPGHHHRATVLFLVADANAEGCEGGVSVGPFELTLVDGVVSLSAESVELDEAAQAVVREGRFRLCVVTSADFRGTVTVDDLALEFGELGHNEDKVEICHAPSDDDDGDDDESHDDSDDSDDSDDYDKESHTDTERSRASGAHGDGDESHGDSDGGDDDDDESHHANEDGGDDDNEPHTITVSARAVEAHLRHGDTLGPCEDTPADDAPLDSDGDGVANDLDDCPDTPAGETVDETGCSVVLLEAYAGPDNTVAEGESVTVMGSGAVVQGEYDPADLVYVWEQVAGEPADFTSDSPPLTVYTDGVAGELVFELTVSTADGASSAVDRFILTVVPVTVESVASAAWHNVAHMSNGTIRTWGWNRHGQLGDGSMGNDVVSADASGTATLVARTDGSVWSFGTNLVSGSSIPVQVEGVTDAVAVGALAGGGMILRVDGSVWGFADRNNAWCDLGEATGDGSAVLGPMPVPGLASNFTAIATGSHHTVALDADGAAWVWGSRFGCTPHVVMDGVVAVAAGESNHSLFLLDDGTVWALGFNLHGQLGNGNTASNYTTPTQVLGLSGIVAVAAGDRHSLFLQDDGTLWTAGWDHDCQLGLGGTVGDFVSTPQALDLAGVTAMAGGDKHSVAVLEDDSVWVWGSNLVGQLSAGTATSLSFQVCTPTMIELDGGS